MSRLAAIVPSLGASPLAGELLDSLRGELAGAGFDGRLIWVQQGGAPPPALDGRRETLVELARPAGFAAAVNAGYAAAGSVDFVALINDDAVPDRGFLAALRDELEHRPELAAAQGVILRHAAPHRVDGTGIAWNRDWQAVQLGDGDAPPDAGRPPFEIFGVSATAALYRGLALRAVANERAPLFDERLGSYYEDVELAVRLREHGFASVAVPAARARHAGQATTGRAPRARWERIYRNRRWVAEALLGERFASELPRIRRRDRRDLVRRLLAADFAAAAGLVAGVRAAERERPYANRPHAGRALADALRLTVGSAT
jgi:GT2 family glycosyltransferase